MDYKIMVYKLIEGERVLVEEVSASDVIGEYVKRKHGEGKYHLTLKEVNE